MSKMITYDNKIVDFYKCPGCLYAEHKFSLTCGMAYENEKFTVSQDWELPIPGFIIVSPKKCVEKFCEMTNNERDEMFDLVNLVIESLRKNKICERFDVIFEEKENRHLHTWIMPRHDWMTSLTNDPINEIGKIFEYAKSNMKNENVYLEINRVTNILKNEIKLYKKDCK